MRVCFFASDKPREQLLADAFLMGARRHGHLTEIRPLGADPDMTGFDVACFVGVKSRQLQRGVSRAGAHYVMLDKGYSRHKSVDGRAGWEYWRVAIDAHQPTARLKGMSMGPERLREIGWSLLPWRRVTAEGPVVFAGSSAKYHEFYGLSHPTTYAKEIVRQLRAVTERPLIYRPKPSWSEATEIKKAAFSRPPETLSDLLAKAHVVVTHGSNSCFEAMLAGVPSIVLGEGVAKSLSSTDLKDVESPRMASDQERLQWAMNMANWQYTEAEMADGAAWAFIGQALHAR